MSVKQEVYGRFKADHNYAYTYKDEVSSKRVTICGGSYTPMDSVDDHPAVILEVGDSEENSFVVLDREAALLIARSIREAAWTANDGRG